MSEIDSVPYRGTSAIVPVAKRKFDMMLWIERFFLSSRVSVVIEDEDVVVKWNNHQFHIEKDKVGKFYNWLIQQPDDQPIAWDGYYRETKKPSISFMSR